MFPVVPKSSSQAQVFLSLALLSLLVSVLLSAVCLCAVTLYLVCIYFLDRLELCRLRSSVLFMKSCAQGWQREFLVTIPWLLLAPPYFGEMSQLN